MEEVEELLGRAPENPIYTKLADQQSNALQGQLISFVVELTKHHNEALAAAMALDPNCKVNSADKMARLADSLIKRHKIYVEKHKKCIAALGNLQTRIGLLMAAEAPLPNRQAG